MCEIAPRTPDLYTDFQYDLIISFIYGGERRYNEYIKICTLLVDLWGEIGVQRSTWSIIFLSFHNILMKFGHELHRGYQTNLRYAYQNLRPIR